MTNEEAIKGLKSLVEVRRKYGDMQTMKYEIECLEMAIEALKAEPCEDVVSREAVLDALRASGRPTKIFDYILVVRQDIMALPSVTPKPLTGHWIDDCPIMTDEGLVRVIRCSCCNEQRKDYYGVSKDYCPKCGAKMEGEGESE